MKKIPTIFKRNPEKMSEVLNEKNPVCLWVFEGKGVATKKYDGTCVKIENGKYYKRREINQCKSIPANFIEEDFDPITNKIFGWVPVDPNSKEDKWHMEAFYGGLPNGTYELIGPKINGNPERYPSHILIRHKCAQIYPNIKRDYEGIRNFLADKNIEGIVFHHPDGRMAKIKKRDFGMERN